MTVDFIFLVVVMNMAFLSNTQTSSPTQRAVSSSSIISSTSSPSHVINVHSFLDRPPAYSDLEKLGKVPTSEATAST